MKIGLLIIDMQKVFLNDFNDTLELNKACEHINYVANLLRNKQQRVIHIQDVEGAADTNAELLKIISEIHVDTNDICIEKQSSNSFWQTNLEKILREHEVEMVIVAGFSAEHCVLFTYNGAIERGFKTVMLQNGILSAYKDVIAATYRDRNVISYPVIELLLK
jgi:nicotinamidase-related amidase